MARILIRSLLILAGFSSCNTNQSRDSSIDSSSQNEIASLEHKGSISEINEDTVLLGYAFGMKESQVLMHTRKLIKQQKIAVDILDKPYFEIASKIGTYKGYITAKYYEGRLYSLGLLFSDDSPIMVFSELSKLYEEKYGPNNFLNKPIKSMDIYERYWFRNNLKIKIEAGIVNATVEYIDLRFEKKQQQKDSLDEVRSKEKVKQAL